MFFLVKIEERVGGKSKASGHRHAVARPVLEVVS
jgi:hypothetical protein